MLVRYTFFSPGCKLVSMLGLTAILTAYCDKVGVHSCMSNAIMIKVHHVALQSGTVLAQLGTDAKEKKTSLFLKTIKHNTYG